MGTPITNFGLVTVSTTYGSGDTSIVLTTGHGSKLPATTGGYTYPLTWWDSTTYPHPADDPNKEIVLVTARSGDTLTVTRGQEGTSASTKNTASVSYRMNLGVTKAMWDGLRPAKNTHQGLVLQTDRDFPDNLKKVEIAALEYLVMDDGTIMSNSNNEWTGKTADITVLGAGGLDTGSELGGVWYDIYAIATESGTGNLLLHKSRAWSDEASYTINEDASQNVSSATSNSFVSQGFQLSNSGKISYVKLELLAVGAPTGSLACAIYNDAAGVPGSALAVADLLDTSSIPASATWIKFSFPENSSVLSASTQYHIILGTTVDASNYIQWRMDGSAGAYASGSKAIYNGTSWTADTDDDMMFTVGIEINNSSVTLPSTYTKKCHLGWVFNNGSSDFSPFIQSGRTRRSLYINETDNYIAILNGTVQIMRMYAPPINAAKYYLACAGTGTQAGIAVIGDCRKYNLSVSGDTTGGMGILYSGTTTTRPGVFNEIIVQEGFCTIQGTSGAKIWLAGFSW